MAAPIVCYEGPIVTRAEAKRLGLRRYFLNKPCRHGHVSERYLDGRCIECVNPMRPPIEGPSEDDDWWLET